MPKIRAEDSRSIPQPRVRNITMVFVLAFALACVVPSTASARDSAARKFGRGLANLSLGVLALPGQVVRTTRNSGPFVGLTWGLVKGVGFTVASEVVGVFELFSTPFETPPEFKPILSPEFPWQYFSESQSAPKKQPTRSVRD